MDCRFECDFVPTVRKSANRFRRVNKGYYAVMLLSIGLTAYVVFCAVKNIMLFGFDPFWTWLALLCVGLLLYCIFLPEIRGHISVRQFKKSVASYHISFGDRIEVRQDNMRIYWEYTEIHQVVRLKYHYELQKDERLGIALDPDTMTGGTFEEFKQFLLEKRPDLIIPE